MDAKGTLVLAALLGGAVLAGRAYADHDNSAHFGTTTSGTAARVVKIDAATSVIKAITAQVNAMVAFRCTGPACQYTMASGVSDTAIVLPGKAARAERFPDAARRRSHIARR